MANEEQKAVLEAELLKQRLTSEIGQLQGTPPPAAPAAAPPTLEVAPLRDGGPTQPLPPRPDPLHDWTLQELDRTLMEQDGKQTILPERATGQYMSPERVTGPVGPQPYERYTENLDKVVLPVAALGGQAVGASLSTAAAPATGGASLLAITPLSIGLSTAAVVAADQLHQNMMNVEDFIRLPEERQKILAAQFSTQGFNAAFQRAYDVGETDMAIQTGILGALATLHPLFGTLRWFAHADTPAMKTAMARMEVTAARHGINFAAKDINAPFTRGFLKMAGVVPVLARHITRQSKIQAAQMSRALEKVLDIVSPYLDAVTLSGNISREAMIRQQARVDVAHTAEAEMWRVFAETGDRRMIPTDIIRKTAADELAKTGRIGGRQQGIPTEPRTVTPDPRTSTSTTSTLDPETGEVVRVAAPKQTTTQPADIVEDGPAVFRTFSPAFEDALEKWTRLSPYATPSEIKAAMVNINAAGRGDGGKMLPGELAVIDNLRGALNRSLDDIDYSWARENQQGMMDVGDPRILAEEALKIRDAILYSNEQWATMKKLTTVGAARQFLRVDRNIFGPGYDAPGVAEFDELAEMYMRDSSAARSPQFVEALDEIIGPENRRALARHVLSRSLKIRQVTTDDTLTRQAQDMNIISSPGAALPGGGSLTRSPAQRTPGGVGPTVNLPQSAHHDALLPGDGKIYVFDSGAAREALGLLQGPNARMERAALDKLLKGTGVNAQQLDDFFETTARMQQIQVGDPSTFLARRLVLSGTPKISTTTAADQLVGGAATVVLSLGGIIVPAEILMRLLTKPNGLRLMRHAMQPNLTARQMATIVGRMDHAFGDMGITVTVVEQGERAFAEDGESGQREPQGNLVFQQ